MFRHNMLEEIFYRVFEFVILTLMFVMFGLQSCDSDDTIVGGGIDPEPELVGCEAANFYDWDSVEFESSLDAGASTWLAFDLTETTLFTVSINQPGFHGKALIMNSARGGYGLNKYVYVYVYIYIYIYIYIYVDMIDRDETTIYKIIERNPVRAKTSLVSLLNQCV